MVQIGPSRRKDDGWGCSRIKVHWLCFVDFHDPSLREPLTPHGLATGELQPGQTPQPVRCVVGAGIPPVACGAALTSWGLPACPGR